MMRTKYQNIKSVRRESVDGIVSFGWPDTKDMEHKKRISDIAMIRVEIEYNFDDSGTDKVFCNVEKMLNLLDGIYYIEDETTGEECFVGNIELIPSIFRNKKFDRDIFVVNDNGKLIFIMYGSVSRLEYHKQIIDIKLSKLLKMQIEAKLNSINIDAKTIEEMLRFVDVSSLNVPDKELIDQ